MAIIVDDRGAVRTITINRPERRNALDPDTMTELGAAFTAAETDDGVRVVVLTGAGDKGFCSGMDLKAFRDSGPRPGAVGTEVLVERVYPKPVIAAVNGAAVGGGLGLALACDLVVAAEHAVFALPEVQRGLVGAGAGSRAALRLPPAVALELILTGEAIDAPRALALGLVNRVVPLADLMATTYALAERIAANGPLAVRVSKEIVYEVARLIDGVDIAALRAKAAPVMQSDDAKEGARAFTEKRAPRFTGR
jgi:enoyl-CoA hydratase